MSIRDRVISVLKEFPETRNDDKLLYAKVIGAMGVTFSIENLEKLPNPESIRRRREEIQNDEHRFIPTDPDVLARRRLYYVLCPREVLTEEGLPVEIINAVCRNCYKRGTEDCHMIGGVPAGLGAMG